MQLGDRLVCHGTHRDAQNGLLVGGPVHLEGDGVGLVVCAEGDDLLAGVGRPVVIGRTVPLNGEHQLAAEVRLGLEGKAVPLAFFQLDAALFELDLPGGVAGVADGDVSGVGLVQAVHHIVHVRRGVGIEFVARKAGVEAAVFDKAVLFQANVVDVVGAGRLDDEGDVVAALFAEGQLVVIGRLAAVQRRLQGLAGGAHQDLAAGGAFGVKAEGVAARRQGQIFLVDDHRVEGRSQRTGLDFQAADVVLIGDADLRAGQGPAAPEAQAAFALLEAAVVDVVAVGQNSFCGVVEVGLAGLDHPHIAEGDPCRRPGCAQIELQPAIGVVVIGHGEGIGVGCRLGTQLDGRVLQVTLVAAVGSRDAHL